MMRHKASAVAHGRRRELGPQEDRHVAEPGGGSSAVYADGTSFTTPTRARRGNQATTQHEVNVLGWRLGPGLPSHSNDGNNNDNDDRAASSISPGRLLFPKRCLG